jgi:hypothetical protein
MRPGRMRHLKGGEQNRTVDRAEIVQRVSRRSLKLPVQVKRRDASRVSASPLGPVVSAATTVDETSGSETSPCT